ncbi:type II secretion system F family protein [Mangrovibrevibacter kandeliae]|uniref:type II secretion system F family protein n=1 Tax=Mangrovibrevibacter kandeliae TaxID=2968473 RepID=UPI002119645E|nr:MULTISPECIES: type II secretion system F family protein [unclassified Aurantimonas]MCQ8783511.1 type II secretion system F family protein [Aurantimonas sp. CSK15Z-1]MCW4115973.1 type II secretion system F family protein [Aurantimonas sp. MSK8Z-1]
MTTLLGVLVAVATFAALMTVALPLLARNELKGRMKAVALERDEVRARERARLSAEKDRGGSLREREQRGVAAAVVERLDLKKALADDRTVQKLRTAGYRGKRPLTLFLFLRALLPIVFFVLAAAYVFGIGIMAERPFFVRLVICLIVAYIGFYAPIFYVSNKAAKRKKSINRAWPDALDLLLICVESGISIEAGFRRVADEIGIQSVPLAEELVLLNAELSYLTDRKQAYENLVMRTDLDGVRSVSTALIQAERYGTPLGTVLRTLAQEDRDIRMNMAEKKAAALPPKLTVPMILFFLPVLFAVIIGPAVIQAMGIAH